ncbi:hypothetical protein Tco_0811245 [Tanacetum coccineum]
MEITATIDRKVKVVSEASIRRHLKLEDSDGISTLPTIEIFKQLALKGQETKVPQPSSPTQTHVVDEAASTGVDDRHGGAATTVSGLEAGQGSGNIHRPLPCPMIHLSQEFTHLEVMRAECNLKGIDETCTKLSRLVKTGISKVSTAGHYLVLLCITSCCYALLSTAGHKLVLLGGDFVIYNNYLLLDEKGKIVRTYRFDETKETSNEIKGSKSSLKNSTRCRRNMKILEDLLKKIKITEDIP